MIYGGLVVIIAYTNVINPSVTTDYLITESDLPILTEGLDMIIVQE
jgi:hypothetical protein